MLAGAYRDLGIDERLTVIHLSEAADAEPTGDESQGQRQSYLEQWREYRERLETRPGWRELVEHARRGAEIQQAYRPDLRRATRRIITDHPVFVTVMSDFHLGSPHTDYDAFLETTDFLIEHEDFYALIAGADQETAFAWFRAADAVLNQTLPPYLQIELFRQWLDEMMPRTLAVCADNHCDERLRRHLGDVGLVWRDDLPYFPAWGILTVEVGPDEDHLARYEFVVTHRYRGSSIYHDLQPALRMMRDIYPLADVYVTAHTHTPAYMAGVFYPEARPLKPTQHFVVAGTFKTGGDVYALANYGGSGVLGLPTLMLWPESYQMQHFESPTVATESTGITHPQSSLRQR